MATHESMINCSTMHQEVADYPVDSCTAVDADCDPGQHDGGMYCGDGSEADVDDEHIGTQMSLLSIENSDSDAGTELLDDAKKVAAPASDDDGNITLDFKRDLSLPRTPARCSPCGRHESTRPVWLKEYASQTEARTTGSRVQKKRSGGGGGGGNRSTSSYYWRSSRRVSESRLERAWEMRRCNCGGDGAYSHSGGGSPCVVVRRRGQGAASMCMDMDEVRACRDLGLELPCSWTVKIPPGAFHGAPPADNSGGGDSPVGSWRISSPGDDPRDVKARLRVWAQAVALASASRLGC